MKDQEIKLLAISQDFQKNENLNYSENTCLLLFSLSAIFFGISNVHLKQIQRFDDYDIYSFAFWRYFFLTVFIWAFMQFKKIELFDVRKVEHRFWFFIRTFGLFLSYFSFMTSLEYIRVSTANCFVCLNPVVVVILSTFILKEKFHIRYLIGIAICFIGVLFIVKNEGRNQMINNQDKDEFNVLYIIIGVFWSVLNLCVIGTSTVASKFLFKENINQENQCFYLGVSNFIVSFFSVVLKRHLNYRIIFILSSSVNSVIFLTAMFLLVLSVKGVDLNKTTPLNYLSLIVVTVLGVMFLGESLYATDILGSLIILGYNIYNSYYPIKH
jgi:drug/metabolite transporter (DMT)-like permease